MNFLTVVKGIGTGISALIGGKEGGVASILKANKDSVSSKRVFKLFGGGALIAVGLGIVQSIDWAGPEVAVKWQSIVGLTLCGAGVFTGWAMKSPDKHDSSNDK